MPSTLQRSFLKGVCWETISFIIMVIAVYIIYGDLVLSIKFSVVLSIIKIFLFFLHERAWKKIKWGKIK
jgi:adenylylsulfate kinase